MNLADRRSSTATRDIALVVCDATIIVLLVWTALAWFHLLGTVAHEFSFLGLTVWLPGFRLLLPVVLLRLLLTPGLVRSLSVHRRRWGWSVALILIALAGAGLHRSYFRYCYADRYGPRFFPGSLEADLEVIRDGYVRLHRHDPEYVSGLTQPDQARTFETYRYLQVGHRPHLFRPLGDRLRSGLELLYSYVDWQAAFDPGESLRAHRAPPARLMVQARQLGSPAWQVVATADIDPQDLCWSWFEPLPPGRRWLQWTPLRVDLAAFGGTEGVEVSISAEGPGASHVVVAATDGLVHQAPGPPPGAPPRVILISLDTLAAGHVGHLGYPRETTPNLDAFAARNVTFARAFAPAPWTAPSHWSMMTGLTPSFHGNVHVDTRPSRSVVTLAELLRSGGYRTVAVTGGYCVSAGVGLQRGFDYFRETWQTAWQTIALEGEYRKDVELNFLHARRWIDHHRDEPFFLFLHTYQPHIPLLRVHTFDDDRAEPRLDPATKEPRFPDAGERAVLRYDSEIRYTDRWLGHFLDWLEAEGLLDESLVVVTSDHGENFRLASLNICDLLHEHGYAFYDDDIRVPLAVHFPGSWGLSPQRIDSVVSLVDLFWTVLAAVRIPTPELADIPPLGRGQNLLPIVRGPSLADADRVIVSEANYPAPPHRIALCSRNYKLVRTAHPRDDGPASVEDMLFELTSDPKELHDRREDLPEIAGALGSQLTDYLKQARYSPFRGGAERNADTLALDEQTLRQLRAIGYVD